MIRTLEAIPNSLLRRRGERVKPEMVVGGVARRGDPNILLPTVRDVTCDKCIFSHKHNPPGPCGGFTIAKVTRSEGQTQDIIFTAGDGFVMNERFAKWAQKSAKDGRKLCATNKQIDV